MLADYIGNNFIVRIVCVICIAASSACVKLSVEELPSTSPYAKIIGAEYRIVGNVSAYGIYEREGDRKVLSYVTLIPGVGIGGSLVEPKGPIVKGQQIRISAGHSGSFSALRVNGGRKAATILSLR